MGVHWVDQSQALHVLSRMFPVVAAAASSSSHQSSEQQTRPNKQVHSVLNSCSLQATPEALWAEVQAGFKLWSQSLSLGPVNGSRREAVTELASLQPQFAGNGVTAHPDRRPLTDASHQRLSVVHSPPVCLQRANLLSRLGRRTRPCCCQPAAMT
jgi:hypothetical protein